MYQENIKSSNITLVIAEAVDHRCCQEHPTHDIPAMLSFQTSHDGSPFVRGKGEPFERPPVSPGAKESSNTVWLAHKIGIYGHDSLLLTIKKNHQKTIATPKDTRVAKRLGM